MRKPVSDAMGLQIPAVLVQHNNKLKKKKSLILMIAEGKKTKLTFKYSESRSMQSYYENHYK
ncbi:CLUMA_CG004845, isoform A [Clunio marinus]|uniref:CLUMA_CG004845, isoform A n=1 Tax=Clunio marinus TaxID=568069 RepID=A0A1J1HSW3_9DIPT|nr:CLUMA_CG004845, isoform A [Clunio marinus]